MGLIIYLIGAVITMFVMWKRVGPEIGYNVERLDEAGLGAAAALIAVPIFWPIAVPVVTLWWVLERIYRLFASRNK